MMKLRQKGMSHQVGQLGLGNRNHKTPARSLIESWYTTFIGSWGSDKSQEFRA